NRHFCCRKDYLRDILLSKGGGWDVISPIRRFLSIHSTGHPRNPTRGPPANRTTTDRCLLPSASCLLPSAFCLLPSPLLRDIWDTLRQGPCREGGKTSGGLVRPGRGARLPCPGGMRAGERAGEGRPTGGGWKKSEP